MNVPLNMVDAIAHAPRFEAARAAIGKALYWRYLLLMRAHHDAPVLERISNFPLLVLPGVLNPRLMRTGEFMAAQVQLSPPPADAEVLDMGTGSGVCAIAAATSARAVTAVDINPVAVRCARVNALINQMEERIEILHGDLFAPVAHRRFDMILFNPPFIHATPMSLADRAWRSTDVADRFAAGLTQHLRPDGFAWVLLSSYGDAARFVHQFSRYRLEMSIVAQRCYVNEKLTLLRLGRADPLLLGDKS